MFYKKFEHYIIFCLIKQITMMLYVSSVPTDIDKIKLFTNEQLHVLAISVCSDLQFDINVTEVTCKENYWAPDLSIPRQPSHVRIRCQTNTILRVQIDPSESYQLVALVPQHVTTDSTVITDIDYIIIDPMVEYGEISRSPKKTYTLWSAVLKQGSPVEWRGGDKAPEYNNSMVHRTYEIKKFLRPSLDGSAVFGRFTWNTSGDGDVCFDVVNTCMKQNTVMSTKVMPNGKDVPQVEIDHLPGEDDCYINVTGLYGTTHFKYRTHSCNVTNCLPGETIPELPEMYIEVTVNWTLPHHLPDYYNVTLITSETNMALVLPGDSTEAVFKDVTGEGIYYVQVKARLGKKFAATTRRAVFPEG